MPTGRLLAAALLALVLQGPAATAATGSAPARIPAEALLAADVPWSTVRSVAGDRLWPLPPGFDSIVDQEDPQPLTAVSQGYVEIGGSLRITTRLYAYPSPALSLEFLQSSALVGGPVDERRPAIGDRHAYYTTTLGDGTPSTRMFFVRGRIGASIRVDGARWSRARVAELAGPIDAHVRELLGSQLTPPALPDAELRLLPAPGAAPGQALGTATIPPEAWATVVHGGSPRAIRAALLRSGNTSLPFRRYLRRGSRSDVIETTLFAFPSRSEADAWFAPFSAGVGRHPAGRLDAGATGALSAFRFQLDNYELQFVSGRYVADVFCWAPFVGQASPACETATRTLAAKWYATLSKGTR